MVMVISHGHSLWNRVQPLNPILFSGILQTHNVTG